MEIHSIGTWFDHQEGVVVVEDDVQNVVRDIKAISDRLHVFYNPQSGGFDIVERCLDHTDRLVFSVAELDARVPNRLRLADHWRGTENPEAVIGDNEDFVAKMDEEQEQFWADQHEKSMDKVRDASLRLAWALDNVKDHHSVGGSIRVPKDLNG